MIIIFPRRRFMPRIVPKYFHEYTICLWNGMNECVQALARLQVPSRQLPEIGARQKTRYSLGTTYYYA